MLLDDRLQAVADFVPAGCRVADIGTDHGYLAQYLYEKDNTRTVIAADKNAGPCEAARKTFAEADLSDKIAVRQGDGLAAVAAGEVNTVCIAGMGGKLIADILAAQPQVFAKLTTAILQPQNGAKELREWLLTNKWHIADEKLAKVDGRVYQIIQAKAGKTDKIYSEIELMAGPVILEKKPALFAEHINGIRTGLKKIAAGLNKAKELSTEQQAKLSQVKERIKVLDRL